LLVRQRFGIVATQSGAKRMKSETDLSYLAAMFYTAAALLVLAGVFAAVDHNYRMAGIWFILGITIFAYRWSTSKTPHK
jgi:uncharacterized membrane protein YgdD (TMEM256/DUF423 family)